MISARILLASICRSIGHSGVEPTRYSVRDMAERQGIEFADAELDAALAVELLEHWIIEGPKYEKRYKRSKPRPGVYAGSQGTHRRSA